MSDNDWRADVRAFEAGDLEAGARVARGLLRSLDLLQALRALDADMVARLKVAASLEINYAALAERIDYQDLSSEIDLSSLADHICEADVAGNMDAEEVADQMDASDVAGHIEIDSSAIVSAVLSELPERLS